MAQSIATVFQAEHLHVSQLKVADLALYAYYIESQNEAIVIDPFVSPALDKTLKDTRTATVTSVLLTHFPTDFVSGHSAWANHPHHKVTVYGPATKASFPYAQLKQGDHVKVGAYKLEVIETPGHSSESLSYVLVNSNGQKVAIFSGDALLAGGAARCDPTDPTPAKELLSKMLSTFKTFKTFDKDLRVFPGHGALFFWSVAVADSTGTTIGQESENNKFLKVNTVEELESAIASPNEVPKYYHYLAKHNRTEIPAVNSTPNILTIEQVSNQLGEHVFVLDMRRDLAEIKAGSIEGSVLFPSQGNIGLWLGTLFNPTDKLIIICEEALREENVRRAHRVGCHVVGVCGFTVAEWAAAGKSVWHPKSATIQEALECKDKKVIFDTRTPGEWKSLGVVDGALCSYFPDVTDVAKHHPEKVPKDAKLFVYCRLALRARIGTSLLHHLGYNEVYIVPESKQIHINSKQTTIFMCSAFADLSKIAPIVPFEAAKHL